MVPLPAATCAAVGNVAEVNPMATASAVPALLGTTVTTPDKSQSPDVKDKLPILAVVPLVRFTLVVMLVDSSSPTLPAAALSAATVPLIGIREVSLGWT